MLFRAKLVFFMQNAKEKCLQFVCKSFAFARQRLKGRQKANPNSSSGRAGIARFFMTGCLSRLIGFDDVVVDVRGQQASHRAALEDALADVGTTDVVEACLHKGDISG